MHAALMLLALTPAAWAGPEPPLVICPLVAASPNWEEAPQLGPFVTPGSGALAEIVTEAWVVAAGPDLVVRLRCVDPDLKALMAKPLAHDSDEMWSQDCIEVFLAPSDPTREYFHFIVSAHGDLLDQRVPGVVDKRDPSWESGARAEVAVGSDAWTCTLRVPFAALGGAPKDGGHWRANFCREFRGGRALMGWAPLQGGFHEPEAFGTLVFGRRAEVLAITMTPPFVGVNEAAVRFAPGATGRVRLAISRDGKTRSVDLPGDGRYTVAEPGDGAVQVLVTGAGGALLARGPAVGYSAPPLAEALKNVERHLARVNAAEPRLTAQAPGPVRSEVAALQKGVADLREWLDGAAGRTAADNLIRWEDRRNRCRALLASALRLETISRAVASGAAPSLILGTETPLRKLHPTDWDFRVGEPAQLAAARRESESVQIVLAPLAKDVPVKSVTCSALVGPEGARLAESCVRIDRVGYVTTRQPCYPIGYVGEWPDPLLPLEPFALAPDRIQPLWLTVTVPPEARPGLYRGRVTVTDGRGLRQELPLELRVWDIELPLRGRLKTALSTGFRGTACEWYGWPDRQPPHEYLRKFYDLMLSHRLNPVAIYDDRMWPPVEDLDYCVARGLNSVCMKCTGSATPEEIAQVRGYLEELRKRHLEDGAYIYGFDEASPATWPDVKKVWQVWKDAIPGIKIGGTYPPNDVLAGTVNQWVPLTPWYDGKDAARIAAARRTAGDEMWWYVCCGPTHPFGNWFIDYPATEARSLFWATYKYGISGFLYYETCMWSSNMHTKPAADWEVDHEDPQALAAIAAGKRWPEVPWNTFTFSRFNGDGLLVYPGPHETPLSSVRLETIRDGIEDYELLCLLADAARSLREVRPNSKWLPRAESLLKVDPALVKDLTHFTYDPRVIEEQRRQVAECLEAMNAELSRHGRK